MSSTKRILHELASCKDNPLIHISYDDSDIYNINVLIIGPEKTPYEGGQFEFLFTYPKNGYPFVAPKCFAKTTNKGQTRFNPNVYANGKVCLDLIGTFGDNFSPAIRIENILVAIQSLLNENPYANEPGFEKRTSTAYNHKITHETLRISICDRLESILKGETENFAEISKGLFMERYQKFLYIISEQQKIVKDGAVFQKMPFESNTNGMKGSFNYEKIKHRLEEIHTKLLSEK